MYRRIDVHEDDAQYQRILWRNDPTEDIKEKFCSTVMFGTSSAPFTAIRTMHQLANDKGIKYPLAVDVIKYEMYVDDILSGGESLERAQELQRKIIAMLHSGTFELRKWAANNPKLLENIPTEHKATHGVLHLNAKETIKLWAYHETQRLTISNSIYILKFQGCRHKTEHFVNYSAFIRSARLV
ncbi:uncharacterized protein LOC118732859 [Rhagoletis pomonella]|uniref:uncharacterized protein LOC118732859 n=1 Tax=Rhagoletis pomonella TaxID=28610 RepID=UPI00177F9064|nr:uncharacterized protein LOC118732859 [Rhagoletis pomonella]